MPSLATQSMSSGSLPFQTLPSRAIYLPFFILGTPEWCNATTSHWSLYTGEPDEPGSVSAT